MLRDEKASQDEVEEVQDEAESSAESTEEMVTVWAHEPQTEADEVV